MRKWIIRGGLAGVIVALVYLQFTPRDRFAPAPRFFESQKAAPAAYLMARHAEKSQNVETAAHYYNEVAKKLYTPNRDVLEDSLRTYLVAGDMAAAVDVAQDMVALVPNHQRANLILALEAFKGENFEAVQTHLNIINTSPIAKFLRPHFDLWLALLEEDKATHNQAREVLLQSKVFQPVNLAQAARAAEYAGDIKTAAQIYNLGVHAKGLDYLFFTLDYAQFLERQGNVLKAEKTYRHYATKRFAHSYIKAGLARLAAQEAPPPLAASPIHHLMRGLQAVSETMQTQGRQELALIYGNLSHYLATDDEEDKTTIALLYYQNAQRAAALSLWTLARDLYLKVKGGGRLDFRARIRAAEIIDEMGDTQTAIATLSALAGEGASEEGADLSPSVLVEMRQNAQIVLGDLYRRHERFAEAERSYSRAINAASDDNPVSWNLYFARGIARERIGEWSQAESDLHKARRLSRNDPHVLNYLGYSWVDKGVYLHESLNILRQAVKAAPNNGFFLDSLGWAYYRLGNYNNALAFVERATQLEPTDATITDHLGDILWRMGRKMEARYQWRKALAFSPSEELRIQIEKKQKHGLGKKKRPPKIRRLPRGGVEI